MALVYAAIVLADVAGDAMEQRRSLLGDTGRTGPNGYALQVGLSAGYSHTCGLDTAGAAYCFGRSTENQLVVPPDRSWALISSGAFHTCGVDANTAEGVCWGNDYDGHTLVPTGHTWTTLSAGRYHTCGITTLGEAYCFGSNSDGQTNVPTGFTWAVISAGWAHTCGVTVNGEAFCWGAAGDGESAVPTGFTWSTISAGRRHTCGVVATTGAGQCWGRPDHSRLNVPAGPTSAPHQWVIISPARYHTCGVTTLGEAICWGAVGLSTNVDRTTVPTGHTWATISCAHDHTCAVTTDGIGLCWYEGRTAQHSKQHTAPRLSHPSLCLLLLARGSTDNGMSSPPTGHVWATTFSMVPPPPSPPPPSPPPPPPPARVHVEPGGALRLKQGGTLRIGV